MTRNVSGLVFVLSALSLFFTACPQEFDIRRMAAGAHGDFTGPLYGIAQGWSSTIRVDLDLEEGFIVGAYVRSIIGRETAGFDRALALAGPLIVATNNVELNTLAGATVTTNAIVAAGRAALADVPAPGAVPAIRYPGTHAQTTEINGWGGAFQVSVTLSRTSITSIAVENSNESLAVGQPAIDILIDRMLQYQTSGVDGVSGATSTSIALQNTVSNILRDAGAPIFMRTPPPAPDGRFASPRRAVDVLVIGSGAAGLSAAIEAASFVDPANPFAPPVSVTLIEKDAMIGGSTRLSSGVIYAPANTGDRILFRDYFLFRAQNHANTSFVETLAGHNTPANNPDLLDIVEGRWALPHLGAGFPTGMAAANRARIVPGGGVSLVRTLENRARELGVNIMTGVTAHQLETHQGAAVQVLASSRTTDFTFDVRRGIVIATGGFDHDRGNTAASPMHNHAPDTRNIVSLSSPGNTGDGIRMARNAGAGAVYKGGRLGWAVIPDVNVAIPNGNSILAITAARTGWLDFPGIAANPNHTPPLLGVDWANNPHDTGQTRNPEDDLSLVFSSLMREGVGSFYQFSTEPFPQVGFISHHHLTGFGLAFTYNDFYEMAYYLFGHFYGTSPSDLRALLNAQGLGNLETWYIWRVEPASLGSMGGLRINPQAQVLSTTGAVIPGLFAAGEAANGDFYFQQNPALGSSLAIALTFGRVAGREAARSAPRPLRP
ncbi:MAG: FAD-dependent oxidoreductase [Treponema sp.]|nr:FAD-dependent oxidoreductase [Treponema sp.]